MDEKPEQDSESEKLAPQSGPRSVLLSHGTDTDLIVATYTVKTVAHQTNSQLTGNLAKSVELSHDTDADLIGYVGRQMGLHWDVYTVIGVETDLTWNVHHVVGTETDLEWHVPLEVGNELELSWDVTGTVGNQFDTFYNVYVSADKQISLLWNTRSNVGTDLDLYWDTTQATGNQLSITWSDFQTVGTSLSLSWNTIQSAGINLSLLWNVYIRSGNLDLTILWRTQEQTKFTNRYTELIETANTNIADILTRCGPGGGGFNPYRTVELYGGKILEPTMFEPDPCTHHEEYYINAKDNRVYRRVYDRYEPEKGLIAAHWAGVSD